MTEIWAGKPANTKAAMQLFDMGYLCSDPQGPKERFYKKIHNKEGQAMLSNNTYELYRLFDILDIHNKKTVIVHLHNQHVNTTNTTVREILKLYKTLDPMEAQKVQKNISFNLGIALQQQRDEDLGAFMP